MPLGIFHPPRSLCYRIPRATLHRPIRLQKFSDSANRHGRPESRTPTVFALTALSGLTAIYFFWPSPSRSAPTFQHNKRPLWPQSEIDNIDYPAGVAPFDRAVTYLVGFVKDDDIQVERPYTPLEGIDANGNLRFWVKQYSRGEVGRWLHSKAIGDIVEIRGPLQTFPTHDGNWDHVVMISGGTGFSPFYQLLFTRFLQNSTSNTSTRYTLVHSSPTVAELPPDSLLRPLLDVAAQQPERLKVHLFVDNLQQTDSSSSLSVIPHVGRINKNALENALQLGAKKSTWWQKLARFGSNSRTEVTTANKNILILVCGPEPMVSALAGPYGRNYSQGAVGGALAELGFTSGQVWKL